MRVCGDVVSAIALPTQYSKIKIAAKLYFFRERAGLFLRPHFRASRGIDFFPGGGLFMLIA